MQDKHLGKHWLCDYLEISVKNMIIKEFHASAEAILTRDLSQKKKPLSWGGTLFFSFG